MCRLQQYTVFLVTQCIGEEIAILKVYLMKSSSFQDPTEI